MMKNQFENNKKSMVEIGKLLWEKDLASGLNGNISVRQDKDTIAITGHGTCLGMLEESQIFRLQLSGEILDKGEVSSEKLLHTEIFKNFPDIQAVVHTHTTYTNAYFIENDTLSPKIFESKIYLGEINAVPQYTPAVTDAKPVIDALKKRNIAVLKNHGVVAMGKNLFDCFVLIQLLEEAVKIEAISRLFKDHRPRTTDQPTTDHRPLTTKKYKLFSPEQIDEIVKIVNADAQMKELGVKTNMNMDLGVKLDETGQIYSFCFRQGNIDKVGHDEKAEFLVSAPEVVWRQVFNREIDPFVATTQKKMNLRGDFAKISKWYAPCSRVFELWQRVPVE